jgi:gliding motility-associated-like protein
MKVYLFILFFILFTINTFATHNRAGEITYRQISDYTYEITVVTFTNTKPTSDGTIPADRPQLNINWGDGTSSVINRIVYYDLGNYYRKNIYVATHTYGGASTFEILVEDPNRNEGVENIPNSINVVFSIKTVLQINPALGFNNTPVLMNPPVDKAAVNQVFIHNPAAYDPDGDSLSYEMTVCLGENGEPIPSYTFPESRNRPIYIDFEGNMVWDTPVRAGVYNVAFNIFEWRHGIKIGKITRDMQIEVFDSDNQPPVIDTVYPVCAIAGETVQFDVTAHDNINEKITLSATGGVFAIDTSAAFHSTPHAGTVTGTFIWNTKCVYVRKQPYKVVFKATDDNPEVNLVDQQSVDITVVGASPQNLQLTPTNNSIELSWDKYPCDNHTGFNIYRSINSYGFNPDECETGVPEYTGFEKIAFIDNPDTTLFLDNNNGTGLNQGYEYCYMITAVFDEDLESMASAEVCTELIRGTPIITNVSVTKHDENTGEIYLAWSKPIDFDFTQYPGNLIYIVKRAEGIWGTDYITVDTLFDFNSDTIYYDKNINTLNNGYSYKVEIHNPAGLTELPMTASSILPQLYGENHKITIKATGNTPWINYGFTFYRKNTNNIFDSIGFSQTGTFIDSGLINKVEYCYMIKTSGHYNLGGIINPIINISHRNCGIPIDTVAPAPPTLFVSSDCDAYVNTLTWTLNSPKNEIMKYFIYGAQTFESNFILIDSVLNHDSLSYKHILKDIISGCYAVTAVDSAFNESKYSNIVCVDVCDYYKLPNVFSPNGDNINDLFVPVTPPEMIDRYIDKIDMKIYSRWGNLVYETTNPHIEWDGKSKQTKKLLEPGVYYYTCDVYEKRISGIEHKILTGFIHIFYDKDREKE